ncbi:MAG: alanyl-tRNA editing protein [Anaerolineales bacterium]
MQLTATKRLYLQNDHCFESEAMVIAVHGDEVAFDQTCFYPGGGGQPADEGFIILNNGDEIKVNSAYTDEDQVIWHVCDSTQSEDLIGQQVRLNINGERRITLTRYHTVLHVLNTIALRDYNGWITGVQIGEEHSRIDFKIEDFSASMAVELENKVNAVLREGHALKSYSITEDEFRNREDLLRTLDVKPPVVNGMVRVVEIEGFDAQACGGTHVNSTADVGYFTIFRTDNKGKKNKRFYVKLS